MWVLDEDGNAHREDDYDDANVRLFVKNVFQVVHRRTKYHIHDDLVWETFDTEEQARAYIKEFVEERNTEELT